MIHIISGSNYLVLTTDRIKLTRKMEYKMKHIVMRVWHTEVLLTDRNPFPCTERCLYTPATCSSPIVNRQVLQMSNALEINCTSAFNDKPSVTWIQGPAKFRGHRCETTVFYKNLYFKKLTLWKDCHTMETKYNINKEIKQKPVHFCPLQIKYRLGTCTLCSKANMKYPSYWGSCQPRNWSSILRKSCCLFESECNSLS